MFLRHKLYQIRCLSIIADQIVSKEEIV